MHTKTAHKPAGPGGGQFTRPDRHEAGFVLAGAAAEDDRVDLGWDGPDDPDPLSPEERQLWDGFHRHAYDYGSSVIGCRGFEDRDTVERFAGFAANAYQANGWNGEMDIHGVVDDWHAQEYPNG
jgi:hypothetical protein